MYVSWKDEYSVDVDIFDEQHKKLFEMINELHACTLGVRDPMRITAIIDELTEYTSFHFSAEERAMRRCEYPEYDLHLQQHHDFKDKVFQVFIDNAAGREVDLEAVLAFLVGWLKRHIGGTDKNYTKHFSDMGYSVV